MAVEFSREGALGYITLDRPPANSYDIGFIQELGDAVAAASGDPEARAVVLRSASDRFFCAGADVKVFQASTTAQNMEMIGLAHRILRQMEETPKVFLAQINGHALGGGLEMALACDLRFAADGDYRVGLPEVTLGLLPGNGGTQRLPRLVRHSTALDLMITGRTVMPAEALELGIVDQVWPAEQLAEQTREYASAIATGATSASGAIKAVVHRGLELSLDEALAEERRAIEVLFDTEDATEGISAFIEKRGAAFRGR